MSNDEASFFVQQKLWLISRVFSRLLCGWVFVLVSGTAQTQIFAQNGPADQPDNSEGGELIAEPIPGVSHQRLVSANEVFQTPPSFEATSNAARLLWSLRRLPDGFWQQAMLEDATPAQPVDDKVVTIRRFKGTVRKVDAVRVPAELADLIELDMLYRLTVFDSQMEGEPILVLAAEVPEAWATLGESLNERVEVTGVQQVGEKNTITFAKRVRWILDSELEGGDGSRWPTGWRLLGSRGFDCGTLGGVAKRSRGPLVAEDNEAFYGMLAAAAKLEQAEIPEPASLAMPELLRNSRQLVGHWLRLDLETARISRVLVSDAQLKAGLGSDFYWQIDGFGELDRVRIELEGKSGDGSDGNLVFENRFPVSVAIVRLPDWLRAKVDAASGGAGRVDVSMLKEPVTVDAFFYRLWSYDSEFATSRGGRQVAPLLIAADVRSRAAQYAASADQVKLLGWGMAVVVIASILLTSGILWRVGRRDSAVRTRRRSELRDKRIEPF